MGNEIVYCARCQSRLLAGEFDGGKAVWHAGHPYCASCLMEVVASLPPEEEQKILQELADKRSRDPAAPEGPARRAPARKTSTARIPIVGAERRAAAGSGASTSVLPAVAAAAILGVFGLLAAVFAGGFDRAATPPPRATAPVADGARPDATIPRAIPVAGLPRDLESERREEAARRALDKARGYGRTNPTDLPGRIALFEEAAWECRGTSFAAQARREHEALQKERGDLVAATLAPAAGKAATAAGAGRYGEAIALLRKEEGRLAGGDWTSAIEQQILQVRQRAEQSLVPLRQKALQARRRGDEDNVRALVAEVRAWGLENLERDLDAALAAAPPPARPADPEVRAYLDVWDAAFGLARLRDYAGAAHALEAGAASLHDPVVKAESAADLETLRLLSAAFSDVMQSLQRAPKNQRLSLDVDAGGSPVRIEGLPLRQGPAWLELKTETGAVSVDLNDLTAGSLRELLGKVPGRNAEADARLGALFPLLEGDPVDLSALPSGSVPPRMVAFAARVAEERARPDLAAKEADARSRYETAERQFADPSTRLESFETYRAILASSADTAFIRRKRAQIAQRLDGEKDAAKEYVFFADQLQAGGAFRWTPQPKVSACWTSTADAPPEKASTVDFAFAARAGVDYRCWVYVGGCCAETFAFDVQGTELGADPGGATRIAVKNGILFLKKTHAQHGGRKEPSRFEWVAIPLPKYASTGPKTLRLLSSQQGFSVAAAVVSAARTAPPGDTVMKDLERARPGVTTAVAADPGLLACWSLDEGNGLTASDSTPNRISGTLRNGAVWTSGKRKGALSFDGQGAYVDIPKTPKLYIPGAFTVAAWVNVAVLPKSEWGMYVVSDYSAGGELSTFSLRVMSSGAVQFFWQTEKDEHSIVLSSARLAPGTWTHLSGVWDGTMRTLYVNGIPDGTNKDAQPRPDVGGSTAIGRPGSFNGLYFNGRIDDVRIYRRALSTSEIRTLAGR